MVRENSLLFLFLSYKILVSGIIKIMKTNQIRIRPMGEFKVTQRTKDGFFNATDLLKQWN